LKNKRGYKVKSTSSCTDYKTVTLEGNLKIKEKNKFYNNLQRNCNNLNKVGNGQILVCTKDDFEMYIYNFDSFVISRVKSENKAIEFLDRITM